MAGLASLLVLAAALFLDVRPAHAATFTVTTTNASGPGSLDQAIRDANDNDNAPTVDVIRFDIPDTDPNCDATTNVCSIAPGGTLPAVAEPLTIDGYSQPGASPATATSDAVLRIELSGAGTGPLGVGLVIRTTNSTVKGLAINRWETGIRIGGPETTGNKVTGNYIGTDPSGTQDPGGSLFGVVIAGAPSNTIGGTSAATRNVISGNDASGVHIFDPPATGNKVTGNFIGTDRDGVAALENDAGVVVSDGAAANTIGGPASGARNVISGNLNYGIAILAGARGTKVMGNFIGTDASGQLALGNTGMGVTIDGASDNTIGGVDSTDGTVDGVVKARNVISGSDDHGVFIVGVATGNRVLGNYIGTDRAGVADLGNGEDGVRIFQAAANTIGGTTAGAANVISGNDAAGVSITCPAAHQRVCTANKVVGNHIGTKAGGAQPLGNSDDGVFLLDAFDNTIGGEATATNVIAFNGGSGVLIARLSSDDITGNLILSNSIFDNAQPGIDLSTAPGAVGNGVTTNDAGDGDHGPNRLQNYPVLSSATRSGSATIIAGTLNSTVLKTFTIQFFSSPAPDPSGNGEGKRYLGQTTVSINTTGTAGFTATMPAVPLGHVVTATATKQKTGDTSEFSVAVSVTA